jgi:threonine/homoserine/homoserine lactone efflux protein
METIPLFWRGLFFGLAIAAPVGPIGVLTIRRTLTEGLLIGLLTGLGAASADALYGTVAALGLTAVSDFLIHYQTWLQLLGALCLAYVGLKSLRQPAASFPVHSSQSPIHNPPFTLLRAYASTLFLTLANPVTILSFTAVFAGFGLGSQTTGARAGTQLVLGVFLGSALWWLMLCGLVTAVRARLSPTTLRLVNIASGLILIGFSVALLLRR